MDYTLQICSLIACIEQNIKNRLDYLELEKTVGFSYRHIREIFKNTTNISLARYILSRKVANAAFEIRHSKKSITEIAFEYNFESHDTFTRAFKRDIGMTPIEFRKSDYLCGRRIICMGVFAPVILNLTSQRFTLPKLMEVNEMSNMIKTQDGCVLYGVPKVYYGRKIENDIQLTPFPMCLQSVLNYMGQNIHYSQIMAASGASFRLRWNPKGWDFAAVDIRNIYEHHLKPFELSFQAAGRSYLILEKENHTKADFIHVILSEIDCGRPVIALGVVGPPEACIITGYKNHGETLLGWSLFQGNSTFGGNVAIDESGYFICNNWWEYTEALMSVGEEINEYVPIKKILENAIDVLTCEKIHVYEGKYGPYYGGQAAYLAWADALENDTDFPNNISLSVLHDRFLCHGDAEVMLGEGRSFAGGYMEWIGNQNETIAKECIECATLFRAASDCVTQMSALRGGFQKNEVTIEKLADKEIRTQTAILIRKAMQYEADACEILKEIINKL